jgi:hypothetical protein
MPWNTVRQADRFFESLVVVRDSCYFGIASAQARIIFAA